MSLTDAQSPDFDRPHFRRYFWRKQAGIFGGMTAFFAAYFYLLNHPAYAVTLLPVSAMDGWLPFSAWWMVPYVSLWLYVPLAPGLLGDRRELLSYLGATVALSVVGLGIFYFWPTTIATTAMDWSANRMVGTLKSIDTAGNACPSLHVAFAVFTAFWFERLLRRWRAGVGLRLGNLAWGLAIVLSTLGTKQHVMIDVAAGGALGTLGAAAHFWWLGRGGRAGAVQAAQTAEIVDTA